MKNILVIGNGFDIAHGLDTKYINFYNFCQSVNKSRYLKNNVRLAIKEELLKRKMKNQRPMLLLIKRR